MGSDRKPDDWEPFEDKWVGAAPQVCDLCGQKFTDEFIDGRTIYGPWTFLCSECHRTKGCGFGTEKGQRFKKPAKGFWTKVEG